jgi:hypothetical protein
VHSYLPRAEARLFLSVDFIFMFKLERLLV